MFLIELEARIFFQIGTFFWELPEKEIFISKVMRDLCTYGKF